MLAECHISNDVSGSAQVLPLKNGRLHLSEGPIDLVIDAEGDTGAITSAYERIARRFDGLLRELVSELTYLRQPIGKTPHRFHGSVASRMAKAIATHHDEFVTPMASVAGAVADEMITQISNITGIRKIYVNDGGDIAFHLSPHESISIGLVTTLRTATLDGSIRIPETSRIRGVATSGMDGRSLSFGIADAVTVLARSAAEADVAATLIANAVDIDDPAVIRAPANELDPDSDLGDRCVTIARGNLSKEKIDLALKSGVSRAQKMVSSGSIEAALLACDGQIRIVENSEINISKTLTAYESR
tara:strand:+ start:57043 stop:57951 length:909 start_codon:yes stop_codon:yes gene_type:complete